VGCTPRDGALPFLQPSQASKPAAAVPIAALPPGAEVKKAPDAPKHAPQAATDVALGDFEAKEAEAPDLTDSARQGRQELARKAYEQAIASDPHCMQAYLSLAQLYVAMKDHAHAEATYDRACQMFPNEGRVFFEMGRCYGGEKQWDDAVKALAHAVELDPENRPYVDTLGWMQARAGHFEESLATFRKVYDEPEAQYHLALMLEHLNQTDLCRQHLQAALEKNHDPQVERVCQAMMMRLAAQPDDAVQRASFIEANKPEAPVPAAAAMDPGPPAPVVTEPAAKGIVLPAPPRIPIRYEDAPPLPMVPTPVTAPALPPIPGPNL
jgi:tetratricopeptide (TPR) repeat protein